MATKTKRTVAKPKKSQATVVSGNMIKSYNKVYRRRITVFAVIIAAIGAATFAYSKAATTSQTFEAKSFTFDPVHAKDIVRDKGTVAQMYWTGTGTKNITLKDKATQLSVVAYGSQCDGAPQMDVKIDGQRVMSQTVSATVGTTYTVPVTIPAGAHVLSFSFTNDYGRKATTAAPSCDRNLYVDKFTFSGEQYLEPSSSTAGSVITSVPASKLTYGKIGAATADGGIIFTGGAPASTLFTLPSATDTIVATINGEKCDGLAQVLVQVDDVSVLAGALNSTKPTDYTIKKALTAGQHTLKVSLLNDYGTASCDRNIWLTKFDFRGTPAPKQFTSVGTRILDPTGHEFIPRGANFMGPDSWWPVPTAGHLALIKDQWKMNTIRLNTCMPGGCNSLKQYDWHTNDDLDKIVKEYTDAGVVVMIANHQTDVSAYPGDPGQPSLDSIRSWWAATAAKYKDNPYVWFDLLNEPGRDDSGTIPVKWRDIHRDLISAVRGTGANNMIIVEGTQAGQDGDWQPGFVPNGKSAILSYGQAVAQGNKNIAFNIHVYNQWATSFTATDAQRDARANDYIDRVHALGLPLFIGETGSDDATAKDGNTLGTKTAYRVAEAKGVGILAWHAQAGDNFTLTKSTTGYYDQINSPTNPTNLSWQGQLLWNFTRNTYFAPPRK